MSTLSRDLQPESQHDVDEKSKELGDHTSDVKLDIPDGGWRAWSILLGVWLIQFSIIGYLSAFGVYTSFYVMIYLSDYSPSEISWIGSAQVALLSLSGLFTGRLSDAGYFRHLVIGGSMLFVFSLYMLSLTHPQRYYQVFLSQAIGIGLGAGMCEVPSLSIIPQYFDHHRALAMGISLSAISIGGAVHPILLNNLFNGPLGFHNGVRASGGLCGGLLLVGLLLIVGHRQAPIKSKINIVPAIKALALERPFALITLSAAFMSLAFLFPTYSIQLNAVKNGISPHLAFYVVTILNAGSTVGRIAPNLLVHQLGTYNLMSATLFLTVVLIFSTFALKDATSTIIFAVLWGFFSGAFTGLMFPLVVSTSKSNSDLGGRLGCFAAIATIPALVGGPIANALLTTSFIWWRGYLFSGLCISVSLVCVVVARYLSSKEKGTQLL